MSVTTRKCTIRGARPSKGEYESIPYDYLDIFIDESLDPETCAGTATQPYRYGKSSNFAQFRANPLPVVCEVDFLTVTSGKGVSKQVVTAVRFPVKQA